MTEKATDLPTHVSCCIFGAPDSASAFNAAAHGTCEVEIKFLVPELPRDPADPDKLLIDTSVFPRVKQFFASRGWIRVERENIPLMTRQLDTPDRALLKRGVTLRVRGACVDSDLSRAEEPDICVKLGKTEEKSGALRRGEYETRIKSFEHARIKTLLQAYPRKEHPELHDALDGIKSEDLREFFRIDCIRNRYVVEIPSDISGVPHKRCVAELIMDEVSFVLDIPGMKGPMLFHQDLEIECEKLSKPCAFDTNPASRTLTSSPMTNDETDRAMSVIRDLIQQASGNVLIHNTDSKAERGYPALDRTLDELGDLVQANTASARYSSPLQHAYTFKPDAANDNSKPHHHMSRDYGHFIRERRFPLARFPYRS